MNNNMNFGTQDGNGSRFQRAQAIGEQKPSAELLDLFAEELPDHHELLQYSTISTSSTIGCAGGTVGSVGTYGCIW